MTRARLRYEPFWVFVDSSGFLADANSNDTFHEEAQAVRRRIIDERWTTYTTNFVIAETHALFITRLGHRHATEFLRQIRQSNINIIRVSIEDEQRADAIIFGYQDKVFSFTDATSFSVMERLGIPYAFTFDRNFAQYGLTVLTPSTP